MLGNMRGINIVFVLPIKQNIKSGEKYFSSKWRLIPSVMSA